MASMENKFVESLLKVMRSRRRHRVGDLPGDVVAPKNRQMKVTQREAQFSDCEGVSKLRERLGLDSEPLENWHRFWRHNPAMAVAPSTLSTGWVLEADSQIVGYMGSIPILYHYGNRALLAAATSRLVVEPAYRAFTIGLMGSFYRQKNIDLFLNTTAIEPVGKLAKAFHAETLPQKDYETVLFWVLDARHFANALARKFGVGGMMLAAGEFFGSGALWAEKTIRGRSPRNGPNKFRVTEIPVSEIDEDFETLWLRKLAEKPRLLADRSPAQLRWHFTIPGSQHNTKILRCELHGRLMGYGVVRRGIEHETSLHRCGLVDLIVENDDPAAIKALAIGAYEYAKRAGCHVFEVLGFPGLVRQILLEWRPYFRKYPACPFFFKGSDPALHKSLAAEDVWYACPYDGDTTLMP